MRRPWSRTAPRPAGARAVAGALAAAAGIAAAPIAAFAQVSPGPLARAHAGLEGALNCRRCHGASALDMEGKCLACHAGIAWLRELGRGLHGRPEVAMCAACHPDHAGADFEMIDWGKEGRAGFDHRRAGWDLEGRHAAVSCDACHQEWYRTSPAASLGPEPKGARRGFTGLEPSCRSCHEEKDVHRGALGEDCGRCHDARTWRPAAGFDHARTSYPLLGRHAPVPCSSCHQAARLDLALDARGRTIPIYRPLPHAECSDCHADPHEGRLGAACASCHSVEGFEKAAPQGFDHGRTRFALRGAHRAVACGRCHDPSTAWGRSPAHERCSDCHPDHHEGQAAIGSRTVDCAECHGVEAWRPSTYTAARHDAAAYPLSGRHRDVACASCHVKKPPGSPGLGAAGVLLRPRHGRCADCHADAHGGQLASRPHRGACEACHVVEGWRPALFTAEQHRALRLPLEGAHAAAACAACHGPRRHGLPPLRDPAALGDARVAFAIPEIACADCHRDPHGGRLAPKAAGGAGGDGAAPRDANPCSGCHDARAFAPAALGVEEHGRFAFRLEGAHRAVPCAACHEELKAPPSAPGAGATLIRASRPLRALEFRGGPAACAGCHRDPHGGQFALRPAGGACEGCHGVDSFRPAARFDHDRDAAFPLGGAHARVPCARCHEPRTLPDGRKEIVYRPVPGRCEACHRARSASR